tara:strand:+ start:558 stop:899 length:342 start_codon:yes stop_codon:yes gene_type:complete
MGDIKWAILGILLLLATIWAHHAWNSLDKLELMDAARSNPEFMAEQLDLIPFEKVFKSREMQVVLTLATGEDPGNITNRWRLTIPANGDTFVFEADSVISSMMGSSHKWERKR